MASSLAPRFLPKMTDLKLGPASGKFPSIVADPLGFVVAYHDEATGRIPVLLLHPDGSRRNTGPDPWVDARGGADAFPTLYVDSRRQTWLAWRENGSNAGILLNLTSGQKVDLGVVHGTMPFAFGDDFVAWLSSPTFEVTAARLDEVGNRATWSPRFGPAAGTGLSHIALPELWTIDELRISVPGVTNPQRAGAVVVGESDRPGIGPCNVALLPDKNCELVLWPGKVSFTPRIAADAGQFAVVTWGAPWGVRLALFTLSELVAPAPPPPPVVVPPPPVQPPAPPAPKTMQLPQDAKAARDRYVEKFPVPQGAQGDAFEEQARQWSIKLSQQVRFTTGDPRWGMKNAGGGRPTSKDTLAYDLGDGRIRIWDLLSGTGTGRPTLVSDPQSEEVTGQQFEPQPAVNHVGAGGPVAPPTPVPVPVPTPTPAPCQFQPTSLTAVVDLLSRLFIELHDLKGEVEALRARIEELAVHQDQVALATGNRITEAIKNFKVKLW